MIVSSPLDAVVNTTPAPDSTPPAAKEATTHFSKVLSKSTQAIPNEEAPSNAAMPVNTPPVKTTDTTDEVSDSALSPYFPYDINFLQAQITAAMQTPAPATTAAETLEKAINTAVVTTTTVAENALQNANTKPNLPVSNTSVVPLIDDEGLAAETLPIAPEQPLRELVAATKPQTNLEHHATAITRETLTAEQAASTTPILTPVTDNTNPLPADNKYANALSQMGQIINAHTAQHASQDIGQANPIYTNTAESLNKAARPVFETHVEFSPVMFDTVAKDTYNANIKIYPPELGHVTAKLKVDKNSAELVILAENNVVKQVIEANLTELRQNFQNADITLTAIHVQTESNGANGQENQKNQQSNQIDKPAGLDAEATAATEAEPTSRRIDSIIDAYA